MLLTCTRNLIITLHLRKHIALTSLSPFTNCSGFTSSDAESSGLRSSFSNTRSRAVPRSRVASTSLQEL
jgi:hypothetical protein